MEKLKNASFNIKVELRNIKKNTIRNKFTDLKRGYDYRFDIYINGEIFRRDCWEMAENINELKSIVIKKHFTKIKYNL